MPLFFLWLGGTAVAEQTGPTGFLDLNAYPYLSDTGNDDFFTVNAFAAFGHGVSYFSVTNVGRREQPGDLPRKQTFYTEQNIYWAFARSVPLDLTAQLNFRSGARNDRYRFGIRWRLSDTEFLSGFFSALHLTYSVNWHAVQIDQESGHVWQLEHVFAMRFPTLSDRLYLAGFVDHTFNQTLPADYPKRPIVGEAQLGFRLVDNLFAVTEYRMNEYRRADVDNLALGLQYKISW